LERLAYLVGIPLFFGLVVGQIGGVAGWVLLGLMIIPLLLLPWTVFATGGRLKQGWWALVPLTVGILGFCAGAALPQFLHS